VTQRYFIPHADRHAGETKAFTKKRRKNRLKAKRSRQARKKP
jgi:hypothetical protein